MPVDLSMPPAVWFEVDDLRDDVHGISREERLQEGPTANIDKSRRLHERSGGAEASQDRHSEHAVRDGFAKGAAGCEFRIDVQSIAIAGQVGELDDILESDPTGVAGPLLANLQIFEGQCGCHSAHSDFGL